MLKKYSLFILALALTASLLSIGCKKKKSDSGGGVPNPAPTVIDVRNLGGDWEGPWKNGTIEFTVKHGHIVTMTLSQPGGSAASEDKIGSQYVGNGIPISLNDWSFNYSDYFTVSGTFSSETQVSGTAEGNTFSASRIASSPDYLLNGIKIFVKGEGLGEVSIHDFWGDCDNHYGEDECSFAFQENTTQILSAAPDDEFYFFKNWTGDCTTNNGSECEIFLDDDKEVTATFNITNLDGSYIGTITGTGKPITIIIENNKVKSLVTDIAATEKSCPISIADVALEFERNDNPDFGTGYFDAAGYVNGSFDSLSEISGTADRNDSGRPNDCPFSPKSWTATKSSI